MRQFWKDLGGYDALVEYVECSVRQLLKKYEDRKNTEQTFGDFMRQQSFEVTINVGFVDFNKYRQDVYLWYLIHPYGCLERFVHLFKGDLKSLGLNINLDYQDKNELEKLIQGMKDSGIIVTVPEYKLDLDKYYHRCRNLLAHKLDSKEKEKIEKLFKKLDKFEIFKFYPTLASALHSPDALTFDDYTLCTANIKNIFDTLTTDVFNSIRWRDYIILEDIPSTKKLRSFNDDVRIKNGINNAFKSKYGIEMPEHAVDIQVEKIKF